MGQGINAVIAGSGAALPQKVLTNHDLEKMVQTSDDWIVTRTGIRERRILEEEWSTVDLAEKASLQALNRAEIDPAELGLILVATVTPDYTTPSTSCLLQARLKAASAAAMDVSAGCSGFVYALVTACQFIKTGTYDKVLVVGVEVLSRVTDWQDRSTCVLFGDGAGAVVLRATEESRGLLSSSLRSDGEGANLLLIPAGGSATPASPETLERRLHTLKMNGGEIFKFAVRVVDETLHDLLDRVKLTSADLDYLFLHQANLRIIEHIRRRLKLERHKVPVNIERYGNMSSATIPVALHEEILAGRVQDGSLIAMIAFGAGLTWGGLLWRW